MDIQEAISEFKMENALLGVRNPMKVARNDLAISALQEQAEREEGCLICNKGVKIMYSPEDDLYPYAAEFCPHCGKRLK
jgi:hypothetical protein